MGRTADFTGVGDYKPVPAGTYEAEYIKYEWKTPKDADGKAARDEDGNLYDYANYRMNITDETDVNGDKVEGKALFTTYSTNPAALWRMKQDAVAAGEDPEYFTGRLDFDVILGNMTGRKVLVTVSEQSFTRADGTVRKSNNIEKVEAIEQAVTGSRR